MPRKRLDMPARLPPRCAIHLLGRFGARGAGGGPVVLPSRRAEELLGYLLLFRERPHHREVLAGRLWPESSTAQSRKYLRQSLWHLRALEPGPGDNAFFNTESDWVQVDANFVWLDVAEMEAAYAPAKLIPGEQMPADLAAALKRVVPLYRGDLLEGCYQDWCVYERERLKAMYLALLEKLLGYCEAHDEPEEGLVYGEELLRHERAHERAHWRLMRLHYLAGDRTAALRQYEHCRVALQEELQTAPGERVLNLYEQIRSDRGLPARGHGPAPARPAGAGPEDPRMPETEPLEEALDALATATRLIEEGIRAVRRRSQR